MRKSAAMCGSPVALNGGMAIQQPEALSLQTLNLTILGLGFRVLIAVTCSSQGRVSASGLQDSHTSVASTEYNPGRALTICCIFLIEFNQGCSKEPIKSVPLSYKRLRLGR